MYCTLLTASDWESSTEPVYCIQTTVGTKWAIQELCKQQTPNILLASVTVLPNVQYLFSNAGYYRRGLIG